LQQKDENEWQVKETRWKKKMDQALTSAQQTEDKLKAQQEQWQREIEQVRKEGKEKEKKLTEKLQASHQLSHTVL
jgi:hypothetical protein